MSFWDDVYEWQKEEIKNLEKEFKGPVKKIADRIYDKQKDIIKKAQDEAIDYAKKEYNKNIHVLYNRLVNVIKQRGFIGRLVAKFLEAAKDDILANIAAKQGSKYEFLG